MTLKEVIDDNEIIQNLHKLPENFSVIDANFLDEDSEDNFRMPSKK